jgi:SAM-dependent methyltransferase
VLELGCGSGNNLLLFYEFGWQVVGIDISARSLADARHNLSSGQGEVTLLQADLAQAMPSLSRTFDVIILPSFNYYVPRAKFLQLLADCNLLLKPGGLFYLRFRTLQDWRFGRGQEVERNGFVLECTETGEAGLLNVFYSVNEIMGLLATHVGTLQGSQVLKVRYENVQNGMTVANDEIVVWGRR